MRELDFRIINIYSYYHQVLYVKNPTEKNNQRKIGSNIKLKNL
ncbi:unnamed protein product [Phyllotreta striolata]|uniref:Uncharacterized protein n=1 Tax=Phyllotreta striolata TaxID=444603 RepID=A0A9N9XH50_PHYSR|nr:unnamed protein product [Phyllotreta striolata]